MKLCDARFHSRFIKNSAENHASRAFPYVQKPQSRSLCLSVSPSRLSTTVELFCSAISCARGYSVRNGSLCFWYFFFWEYFFWFFSFFFWVFFGGRGWREVCLVLLLPRRSKERAVLCVPSCVCCRSIWFVLVLVFFFLLLFSLSVTLFRVFRSVLCSLISVCVILLLLL